jgi:hypothetical protein
MSIAYLIRTPALATHNLTGRFLTSGMRHLNSLLRQVTQATRPMNMGKPMGVYLPDRVWQRQSALYMSLQDLKRAERRHE